MGKKKIAVEEVQHLLVCLKRNTRTGAAEIILKSVQRNRIKLELLSGFSKSTMAKMNGFSVVLEHGDTFTIAGAETAKRKNKPGRAK